jgi:hypothetical protein
MPTTVGSGRYQYELNESWARLPTCWAWGTGQRGRDRLAGPRLRLPAKGSTVVVFDRNGTVIAPSRTAVLQSGTDFGYLIV